MEVTYLGHASFKIKGKSFTVVTDPYDSSVSKFPRDIEANMITVSHEHADHNAISQIKGVPGDASKKPFLVRGPGEYEVGGVSVIGVHTWHDDQEGKDRGSNTAYVIEIDGMRLVHLGDLGHKLNQAELGEIGSVDIVFVPVGGFYTIDAKTAAEVVQQLDPGIVIPMHYASLSLQPDLNSKLAGVEEFLKEMGKTEVAPVPKLTVTGDRLPPEAQVVVLERK